MLAAGSAVLALAANLQAATLLAVAIFFYVVKTVKEHLDDTMRGYGWEVISALVTDVDPADNLKTAMNEIQTQARLQVAAQAKSEANKILMAKNAEAEAEPKRLQGEGIANQRKAAETPMSFIVSKYCVISTSCMTSRGGTSDASRN